MAGGADRSNDAGVAGGRGPAHAPAAAGLARPAARAGAGQPGGRAAGGEGLAPGRAPPDVGLARVGPQPVAGCRSLFTGLGPGDGRGCADLLAGRAAPGRAPAGPDGGPGPAAERPHRADAAAVGRRPALRLHRGLGKAGGRPARGRRAAKGLAALGPGLAGRRAAVRPAAGPACGRALGTAGAPEAAAWAAEPAWLRCGAVAVRAAHRRRGQRACHRAARPPPTGGCPALVGSRRRGLVTAGAGGGLARAPARPTAAGAGRQRTRRCDRRAGRGRPGRHRRPAVGRLPPDRRGAPDEHQRPAHHPLRRAGLGRRGRTVAAPGRLVSALPCAGGRPLERRAAGAGLCAAVGLGRAGAAHGVDAAAGGRGARPWLALAAAAGVPARGRLGGGH